MLAEDWIVVGRAEGSYSMRSCLVPSSPWTYERVGHSAHSGYLLQSV